jgi:hypothetical protein
MRKITNTLSFKNRNSFKEASKNLRSFSKLIEKIKEMRKEPEAPPKAHESLQ